MLILTFIVIVLASCGITGNKWKDDVGRTWEFKGGKVICNDTEAGTYKTRGDKITLTISILSVASSVESTAEYTYEISGNTLTLTCESEIFTKAN